MKKLKFKLHTEESSLSLKDTVKDVKELTRSDIVKLIKKELKSSIDHFNLEDGGWRLDKQFITSQLLYKILGFHISDAVTNHFLNQGLVVSYEDGMSYVETREKYAPIYMNEKTGKLVIVKDSDDKSYIGRYTEAKGYVYIGRL